MLVAETSKITESRANMFNTCIVCLLNHLVKHGRFDDNSLGEKIGIKPHLQPLDLRGELISIDFLFNRMLRTKICF